MAYALFHDFYKGSRLGSEAYNKVEWFSRDDLKIDIDGTYATYDEPETDSTCTIVNDQCRTPASSVSGEATPESPKIFNAAAEKHIYALNQPHICIQRGPCIVTFEIKNGVFLKEIIIDDCEANEEFSEQKLNNLKILNLDEVRVLTPGQFIQDTTNQKYVEGLESKIAKQRAQINDLKFSKQELSAIMEMLEGEHGKSKVVLEMAEVEQDRLENDLQEAKDSAKGILSLYEESKMDNSILEYHLIAYQNQLEDGTSRIARYRRHVSGLLQFSNSVSAHNKVIQGALRRIQRLLDMADVKIALNLANRLQVTLEAMAYNLGNGGDLSES